MNWGLVMPLNKKMVSLFISLGICLWAFVLLIPVNRGYEFVKLCLSPMPTHLLVPVDRVTPSQLVNTWGEPRSGGRRHEGIDIFAEKGTAVLSTTEGIVLQVGINRLGGNVVTVLGPGGYYHYYAHLSRYGDYLPGDKVRPRDVLGYVGNTGNAVGTPPHLHYGIYRLFGKAVNPYPFLTYRYYQDKYR